MLIRHLASLVRLWGLALGLVLGWLLNLFVAKVEGAFRRG